MTNKKDREIIHVALQRFKECCNEGTGGHLNKSKLIKQRAELLQGSEKCMVYLTGSRYSVVEKRAYCDRGKKLYRKYCNYLKKNPDLNSDRLVKNMDKLLPLIAKFEAECFGRVRQSEFAGDKIDLEQILSEASNIVELLHKPIDMLLRDLFGKKNYTVIGEDTKMVYISNGGKKYHRKDCPYCKNVTMRSVTMTRVNNLRLEPCKCIDGKGHELNEQQKASVQDKSYVTAFVDESIRKNPWSQLDESIPKQQGIYSYIICRGLLESEQEIMEENTLYTCVAPTLESNSIEGTAIEAIQAVLFALVLEGYHDNVQIYTDNRKAMDAWRDSNACKNVSGLFKSVMVCHISREKNKKADKLGRKRTILDVPTKTMDIILRRDKEVKKILEGWFAE